MSNLNSDKKGNKKLNGIKWQPEARRLSEGVCLYSFNQSFKLIADKKEYEK